MATMESRSVRRREDARLLTGKGNYTADGAPADALHVVLVRSPHAHATFGSIDTSAARVMPGVIGVFTAADLTDVGPIPGGIGFPRPDGGPSAKTDRPLLAAIASASSASRWRWWSRRRSARDAMPPRW